MDFQEYQKAALITALYPGVGENLAYPALGLNGESGEVAEIVKKVFRDNGGILDNESRAALKKELGDVLWYVAALCHETQLDMADIARSNLEKLSDRQARGALGGSGDDR